MLKPCMLKVFACLKPCLHAYLHAKEKRYSMQKPPFKHAVHAYLHAKDLSV